jgi:hypothetical protein
MAGHSPVALRVHSLQVLGVLPGVAYWQLFSLLTALISMMSKESEDDFVEVKTLLGMALEKATELYSMIQPAPEVKS